MTEITAYAYPRAGLLGNPSDAYHGKTISFAFKNFAATVVIRTSTQFTIHPAGSEPVVFPSLEQFVNEGRSHPVYSSIRSIGGTVRHFLEYCQRQQIALVAQNFELHSHTTIPRQVGLAGSSALVTATLRALMQFFGISIPLALQPTLNVQVETEFLNIPAGLQDSVAQVYEGIVYMDFDARHFEEHGHGYYEKLHLPALPNFYIAYSPHLQEDSAIPLRKLRVAYDRGDPDTVAAMQRFAAIAEEGKACLLTGQWDRLNGLINENFDLRSRIFSISAGNHELVATARATGASAKFSGSGGAIVGIYHDERMFQALSAALSCIGAIALKPIIT
jgi:glucuronokinase